MIRRTFLMPLLNSAGASPLVHFRLRTIILKCVGAKVSLRCNVSSNVFIRTPLLTLGRGTSINHSSVIDNRAPVKVGERVGIGIGVRLITSDHDYSDPSCRAGAGSLRPIAIEDGAWLGSGVTVLAGVTVGRGVVVAAGAVVTRDCEPHTLYAGVPARAVRSLGSAGHAHSTNP